MKAISVIKSECSRVRKNSALHIFAAISAAVLVSALASLKIHLDMPALSTVQLIIACAEVFVPQLLFGLFVRIPKRSVFWFTKCLYIICTPVMLILLSGVLLEPSKGEMYSENFVNRFLPVWAALWWLGCIGLYVLMRLVENAAAKGLDKGNVLSKFVYDFAAMYTPQKTISKHKREGKSKWVISSLCMLMITIAVFIGTVTMFLYSVYTNMEFEAILFTMRFAAGGLAIEDIISGTAIVVIFVLITLFLCYNLLKCFNNSELVFADTNKSGRYTLKMTWQKRALHIILSAVLLFSSVMVFSNQTKFLHYVEIKQEKSDIYENYYVRPDNSVLTFPEKKRNLIFIYLESIENTYASKDVGGSQDKNYISELTELAEESGCVNFSNTDRLGGASVFVPAITYTMGSTVAQTSGIAMNTKILPEYNSTDYPDMIRLEDILHDNGYNQLYIEGSKGEFSMYDKYVGRYDDCTVFDRKTASDEGYTDESADYMWKWGIEDRKLFDITKELITDISKKDKPFFVTMYTMDTHTFESGHRCPNCDSSIKNDYLASVDCTSRQTLDFVNWVKQQPFYDNTTIILVGDHLGNKKTTKVDIDDDYVRTTYNCFINPAKTASDTHNRLFSSLDMFPSTLSAIGVNIKGDRLGLGTDLFSDTPTLCEKLGEQEYKDQLEKTSDYYDKVFYGK